MRIAVYNSKGGAGKSPISTNIALEREYALGTNDANNVYEMFLPDVRFMEVEMEEEFPVIPDDIDIVFDLAGSMSASAHSITSAISQADLVIIPVFDQVGSIQGLKNTLREVSRFNSSLLVVPTKLEKERVGRDYENFGNDWSNSEQCKRLAAIAREIVPDVPVLPLKKSDVYDRITEKEKSIAQLSATSPLLERSFRVPNEQFNAIFDHIDMVEAHARKEQPKRA